MRLQSRQFLDFDTALISFSVWLLTSEYGQITLDFILIHENINFNRISSTTLGRVADLIQ